VFGKVDTFWTYQADILENAMHTNRQGLQRFNDGHAVNSGHLIHGPISTKDLCKKGDTRKNLKHSRI
jgi:hypothetical protein